MPKPKSSASIPSANETRFRALIEHAHDGIILYDKEGTIQYASPAIQKFGGYTEKELLGKQGSAFVHPDEVEKIQQVFYTLKPGQSITFNQRLLHKKGHCRWGETTLTNQLHVPQIKGIICNFRDITDRKTAEEQAGEYRELLETITENVQDGIFLGEFGEKFLYANSTFLKIAGYKNLDDLKKIRPRDFYVDDAKRLSIIDEMIKYKVVRNVELQFYRKTRKKIWGRMTISLLATPDRQQQYIGTLQDITQYKEAELKLRESQQLLTSISNNIQEGFFRSSPTKGLVYVNDSYARIFGYQSSEEVLKIKSHNFYADKNDRKKLIGLQEQSKKISNAEILYKRKDGSTFFGSLNCSMFTDENGNVMMDGVIRDITELKKNEESIHQLNANLQAIMESTQESIYALDINFRYLAFNENHHRIMKLLYGADIKTGGSILSYLKGSPDEKWYPKEIKKALLGQHFVKQYKVSYKGYKDRDIRITFNPIRDKKQEVRGAAMFVVDVTEQIQVEARANRLLANLTAVLESTKDRIFAVDKDYKYIAFNKAHNERAYKRLGHHIKEGDSIIKTFPKNLYPTMEANLTRALEGEYFMVETTLPDSSIVEVSYSPVKDVSAKVTGAAAFIRDVTLRKKNEQRIRVLNQELVNQNWKLEAREEELKIALEELSERNFELDQFMYKTSHDLRSPLSSVLGLINLAKLDSEREHVTDYMEKIEGRVRKLDEFVRSMLSYAKVSRAEITTSEVNLQELVASCIRDLEYLDNFKKLEIKIINKTGKLLRTDAMTLRLVFANIISNTFKYYNPAAKSYLKITIEVTALKASVSFIDNGIGIHKEYLARIFEMFFRATEKSEGSGLGMYIVKQAVDKLGGKIKIDSEYGKGTTIRLTIPNL